MSNIRPGGIFDIDYNPKYLPDDFADKYKQFLLQDGDVVIAMTDLANSPKILGVPTVIKTNGRNILLNQRVGKLIIRDKNKVHFPYLKLALNYPKTRAVYRKFAGGGLQINLGKADLLSVQIPLPPLAEQKRIAGILDAADALRAKRRESLAQLDTLLKSTFLDMFGDPVTNPMGWEVRDISDACVKITDGTHHSPPICDNGIPYITAKHLKKDGLKFFNNPWFVSPEHHAEIFARCDPEPGDVLYIKDGATTGIAAINRYDFEFSMLSSLALLKPLTDLILSEYLCAYLNNDRNKSHLIGNMGGAAIKRLTLTKIKKFRIPLPPIDLQHRFSAIVESVEQQKASQRAHLGELDTLFSSLQSRAFRGDL
jgi:type I restriction enzyme S subunit